MMSLTIRHEVKCANCGAPISASLRYCPACHIDAGAPNVRVCCTEENLKALDMRFNKAKAQASANKCSKEFCKLLDLIEHKSGVIISMLPGMARALVEDPKIIYTNYEKLVGNNVRKPASIECDRQRFGVSGIMFGSYANEIRYGVLSLTKYGLPTYGAVHCRLRDVTVTDRTSFLETNCYKFVEDYNIQPGEFPNGYIASWKDRHKLVLTKLSDRLAKGQTNKNWQEILIESDGKDRNNDNFVEAHIFEGFDRNAIESMVVSPDIKLSRENKMDLNLALATFKKISEKT